MTHAGGWARKSLAVISICALVAGCADMPGRQHAAPAATTAALDPAAADAIRRMSATIAAAPAFTVRMSALREGTLPNGQTVLLGATTSVAARRPDRLATMTGSDIGNFGLWYDGAQVTVFNPSDNVYARTPFTGPLGSVVAWLEERLGIEIPIRPLLAADPYAELMPAGTTGVMVGRTLIGGVPVEHYAMRNATTDWEVWIESGARALPRRVSVVDRAPGSARIILVFDEWNLAPRLPDRAFVFVPPPGAVVATQMIQPE